MLECDGCIGVVEANLGIDLLDAEPLLTQRVDLGELTLVGLDRLAGVVELGAESGEALFEVVEEGERDRSLLLGPFAVVDLARTQDPVLEVVDQSVVADGRFELVHQVLPMKCLLLPGFLAASNRLVPERSAEDHHTHGDGSDPCRFFRPE